MLQRLVDLCIVTSKVPSETLDDAADRLKGIYHLCCLDKKQLLLKTLVSPLLRLNLIHLVLMDTHGGK